MAQGVQKTGSDMGKQDQRDDDGDKDGKEIADDPDYSCQRKPKKLMCQICGRNVGDIQLHIRNKHANWISAGAAGNINQKKFWHR